MKKRIFKLLLLMVSVILSMTMFAACFSADSAYDIAVKNGFVGTQVEWLNSLKGSNGANGSDGTTVPLRSDWEEAVRAGTFTGTFEEYLAQYYNSVDLAAVANNCIRSVVSIRSGVDRVSSAGAGVIIDGKKNEGEAYIVTNYHVLFDATAGKIANTINVYLYGYEPIFGKITQTSPTVIYEQIYAGRPISASYVGGSNLLDIAVLKISDSGLYKNSESIALDSSRIYNSDNITQGMSILAIGNPQALGITTTKGVVSKELETLTIAPGDSRSASVTSGVTSMRVMRIDTAINSGNSGGGLFNTKGQLVGIVNAKDIQSEVENIAYAIPSNVAMGLARSIISGKVTVDAEHIATKCFLGITTSVESSTSVYTEGVGMRTIETVSIRSVPTSLQSTLKVGDIIKTMQLEDGSVIAIEHNYQLNDLLLSAKKSATLKLGIERAGTSISSTITLGTPISIDSKNAYAYDSGLYI